MIERGAELAKFPFPTLDAAFLASLMRGLMAVLILGGLVALVNGLVKRWLERADMQRADLAPEPRIADRPRGEAG